MRYRAGLTGGALKVPESRVIADLLLRGCDEAQWEAVLYGENALQTRGWRSTQRLVLLIRKRLETMGSDLWRLVRDGSGLVAAHACLAAAVKESALLGDFLDLVVREQYRIFSPALSNSLWERYVDDCRGRDPEMPAWSLSTIERLRSSVFQILAQAGYVENTRTLKLQTVHIALEVLRTLRDHDERYVLRCIEVSP
ncbi:MAG: DUF1819 family protein [Thermoanaerobaculia bacterium]